MEHVKGWRETRTTVRLEARHAGKVWVDCTFPKVCSQYQVETWTYCSYMSGSHSWGSRLSAQQKKSVCTVLGVFFPPHRRVSWKTIWEIFCLTSGACLENSAPPLPPRKQKKVLKHQENPRKTWNVSIKDFDYERGLSIHLSDKSMNHWSSHSDNQNKCWFNLFHYIEYFQTVIQTIFKLLNVSMIQRDALISVQHWPPQADVKYYTLLPGSYATKCYFRISMSQKILCII